MVREIIVSLTRFDWGIAIPFLIFGLVSILIIKDVNIDVEQQNRVLDKSERKSRYE